MDAESKCPVMHGAITKNMGEGTSNREWWPNQLNLNILHQHGLEYQSFLQIWIQQVHLKPQYLCKSSK